MDLGAQQFADVASAFEQIVGRAMTATEAAKEIGLSTQQQATAVAQVTSAVASVAQATKETEVSTEQTFQTASELAGLSTSLLRIVQAGAAAA